MTTMTRYPHIVKPPGEAAHLQSHPRTRVAMLVVDYIDRGLSPEEIVHHYPYLKLSEVHAAMAYYHDNRAEIDAEIQDELDQLDRDPYANVRSPVWQKLKSLGQI